MVKELGQPAGSSPNSITKKMSNRQPLHLGEAILKTVAYADIFDYPLRPEEIHRYMVGTKASFEEVLWVLQNKQSARDQLKSIGGCFVLAGRESIYETRRKRKKIAAQIWPRAIQYGRIIAALPYTRMVAVSGALAVSNVNHKADIDYFIITEPRRVWLCRAFAILLVRYIAQTKKDVICPNYFVSEERLTFSQRSLYTAHELAQMIPIAGMDVYRDLRKCNPWIGGFLPNAMGPPAMDFAVPANVRANTLRQMVEGALRKAPGDWLETWEMQRKIRKFSPAENESQESAFCADWCKGHFENHGERTLEAYNQRVRSLGLDP